MDFGVFPADGRAVTADKQVQKKREGAVQMVRKPSVQQWKRLGKNYRNTKTIEDICQLLQCQPDDLIEWKVALKPELAFETRFKE